MPNPTWSSLLGIAKESTYGTPVAATQFIPASNTKADDTLTYLDDKAWRGAPNEVFDSLPGASLNDVSWDGPVFADTVGFPLAGVFGCDDVTGTAAPYTHVLTLNNTAQPKSYTLADVVTGSMRTVPGVVFEEVSFKGAPNELFTYTTKAKGQKSVSLATKPTSSFSTVRASAGWSITPQINGATVNTLESFEVDIKRGVEPIYSVGSQSTYAVYSGLMNVTGKLTMVMEDEVQMNNYLSGTYLTVNLNLTQGTGATATAVAIQMSKVQYSKAVKNRSKDYLTVELDFRALGNSTDAGSTGGYSPAKITLTNALPSGTYC